MSLSLYALAQSLGLDELALFSDLGVTDLAEAGHWRGQEKPEWFKRKLGGFLASIDY